MAGPRSAAQENVTVKSGSELSENTNWSPASDGSIFMNAGDDHVTRFQRNAEVDELIGKPRRRYGGIPSHGRSPSFSAKVSGPPKGPSHRAQGAITHLLVPTHHPTTASEQLSASVAT